MNGLRIQRRQVINVLSVLLSIACIFIIFAGVDLESVQDAMAQITLSAFMWSLLLTIGIQFLSGARSWFLLEKSASLKTSTTSLFIGNLVNAVVPLRLGEVLRMGILKRNADIPLATGLSMVVLSQVLDVAGLLWLALLLLILAPPPQEILLATGIVGVLVLVALVVLLIAARTAGWQKLIRSERLQGIINNGLRGLGTLRDLRRLIIPLLLTMLFWIGVAGSTWLLLPDLVETPSFAAAVAVAFASGIGRALPALPGSLGTLDFAVMLSLQAYGVNREVAVALVVLIRIRYILMTVLTGLGAVLAENLSLQQMSALARRNRATITEPDAPTPE